MRAVCCRVRNASVSVDGSVRGRIDRGLLVYLGVIEGDDAEQALWMARKLLNIRLLEDGQGKINLSVKDAGGGLLLIPNFTLGGKCRKGNRPDFTAAARPEAARELFNQVAAECAREAPSPTGIFGADMRIEATMDGPVTVILDSRADE